MVRSSTPSRCFTNSCCIGDVARIAEPHDFVTLSGLLKAFSLQLELKILAIYEVVTGLAHRQACGAAGMPRTATR